MARLECGISKARDRPLVSVVIASYNHAAFIERAITSITSQGYSNIEIIVIDDGSTDNSPSVLYQLQEKYKFRLIEKKNGGIVSVLNMSIPLCNGKFIVFHASDDESLPDRISQQVEVLKNYPKAAFVSSNASFKRESGQCRGTLLPIAEQSNEYGFDDIFLGRALLLSVSCMYRASCLRKMNERDPLDNRWRAEDPQIFLRLTRLGFTWVQQQGKPIINYHLLHTSQSQTIMTTLLYEHCEMLKDFSDHPNFSEALALIRTALVSCLAEYQKKEALREICKGNIDSLSCTFFRAMVKLALPKKAIRRFKRAG